MPQRRRRDDLLAAVADPAASLPSGRIAVHAERRDSDTVEVLVYYHGDATPAARFRLDREVMLHYAHLFLEVGLRRG